MQEPVSTHGVASRRKSKVTSKWTPRAALIPLGFDEVEIMCAACELYETEMSMSNIAKTLSGRFVGLKLNRESAARIVRKAIQLRLYRFSPPHNIAVAKELADNYNWGASSITVAPTTGIGDVARVAAENLLLQVKHFASYGKLDTVHIGFAGGRLLRLVAENLAQLLQVDSEGNPKEIVFHAMVAAFSDSDYESDPNNFISYFVNQPSSVKFKFLPIVAPGIVETQHRDFLLNNFKQIKEVFDAAKDLNIIVSSGGDWEDAHSTTHRYLAAVGGDDVEKLKRYRAIGDMLWQPLAADGPIDMDNGDFTYRPNTLVDLKDLPGMISNNVRVLLVLGPCGQCGQPKGSVLDAILGMEQRLVTDVVTHSPAARQALAIQKAKSVPPVTKPR